MGQTATMTAAAALTARMAMPRRGAEAPSRQQAAAMTRELRREIAEVVRQEVRSAVREALTGHGEVWLTKEQLMEQFGFLTNSFMRDHGHTLPRTQAVVTLPDGSQRTTRVAYPRNRIQEMIQTGEIKALG